MSVPKEVSEPHKELRFTRAAQAQNLLVVSAIATALGMFILVTSLLGHPNFHWGFSVPFFLTSGLLIRLSIRCTRHAYLILTPLGLEIFPLIKPEKNLNLIYWSQIHRADFQKDQTILRLHFDQEGRSGVVLSLKPIAPPKRLLLEKALKGRLTLGDKKQTPRVTEPL